MTRRLHLADPSQRANTGIGAERKDVTLPNGLLLTALKQSFALRPSDGKVCPIAVIARRSPTGAGISTRPALGRRFCCRTVVQTRHLGT